MPARLPDNKRRNQRHSELKSILAAAQKCVKNGGEVKVQTKDFEISIKSSFNWKAAWRKAKDAIAAARKK